MFEAQSRVVCTLMGLKTEPVKTEPVKSSTLIVVFKKQAMCSRIRSSALLFLKWACMNSGAVST
jgi:hypothetical protein